MSIQPATPATPSGTRGNALLRLAALSVGTVLGFAVFAVVVLGMVLGAVRGAG